MKTYLITLFSGNRINVPKGVIEQMQLKVGDKMLMRHSNNGKGFIICKPNIWEKIEIDFNDLDQEFEDLINIFKKVHKK